MHIDGGPYIVCVAPTCHDNFKEFTIFQLNMLPLGKNPSVFSQYNNFVDLFYLFVLAMSSTLAYVPYECAPFSGKRGGLGNGGK